MLIPSIVHRRSIRKYTDQPVEEDKLMAVLEAARLAPSGNNSQPWYFIVITDPEVKAAVIEADHAQAWMRSAPVLIACVADAGVRLKDDPDLHIDEDSSQFQVKQIVRDTAIATTHILLQADALGLGTCWTGFYNQQDMRAALHLPTDKFVVGIITLGYPAEDPPQRSRRALEDMVRFQLWE